MRPTPSLVALALSVVGCATSPVGSPAVDSHGDPLIGGAITSGDPAVVALGVNSSSSFCTGTLISPSVILTAAHCIDDAQADPGFIAYFGDDFRGPGRRIGIDNALVHPGWDGSAGEFDIGLLLLGFPQDPELPALLNTTPVNTLVGEDYRQVGFGISTRGASGADGKKRQGTTTITDTESDLVVSGDETVSTCFGDSGGPGFVTIDDVEYVAGVHSTTTGQDCNAPNRDTRVDLYVDDFIMPYIAENDTTCEEDRVCARIGCVDDPDCLPCGPDGTCTADCALPDSDCPTSALGEICQANSQCMTELCLFWQEDVDYKFCTENCNADSDCPDGMACKGRPGVGSVCYFTATPSGVIGDTCSEHTDCGTYMCMDGKCTKECDASRGKNCPNYAECQASGDMFVCVTDREFGNDGNSGGGCRTGKDDGHLAVFALLLLALAAVRRRVSPSVS